MYSRRDFGRLALAGLPLSMAKGAAADSGVRIGVARPLAAPLSALDEADLEMLQLAHNLGDVGAVLDHCPDTDLEAAKRLLGLFDGGYLRRA